MKKFSYSLQKILDLRRFEQKQAEAELGKINGEISRIQNELDSVAQKKLLSQQYSDKTADVTSLRDSVSYLVLLDQKKEELLTQMAKAKLIADEKRDAVRKCMQNVKVLEKLKAKKLESWNKEYQAQEELIQDDVVTSQQVLKQLSKRV